MADETEWIHCRFCRGSRPVMEGRCRGCSAPKENARVKSRPRVQAPRRCPRCSSRSYSTLEDKRFSCRDCGAVYEDPDFTFVDDRPDRNAEKQERAR